MRDLIHFMRLWRTPGDRERAQKQRALRERLVQAHPLRVVLGAGPIEALEWITTDADTLNVCSRRDWSNVFGRYRADSLLAEHVWEHLTSPEVILANQICFRFLKRGGRLRLAVPDGLHPDDKYREQVRPGGSGLGAGDHKVLYDFRSLSNLLTKTGFQVNLLEYWDENGKFVCHEWSSADGHIRRSKRYDPRNQDGSLTYTSLIVDAIRP